MLAEVYAKLLYQPPPARLCRDRERSGVGVGMDRLRRVFRLEFRPLDKICLWSACDGRNDDAVLSVFILLHVCGHDACVVMSRLRSGSHVVKAERTLLAFFLLIDWNDVI